MDAAIGFVVARGDPVERARLSWLRASQAPHPDVLAKAEMGQAAEGGWPAVWGQVPSVDATCFHLAELDDLGALGRPAARKALNWLATTQRPDGTWEEDESLAEQAPPWARPGDPEARLYLTASAAYWLTVASLDARVTALDSQTVDLPVSGGGGPVNTGGWTRAAGSPVGGSALGAGPPVIGAGGSGAPRLGLASPDLPLMTADRHATAAEPHSGGPDGQLAVAADAPGAADADAGADPGADSGNGKGHPEPIDYGQVVGAAAQMIAGSLRPDGSWPSFLVTGWLGAAVLYRRRMYYEFARIQLVLVDRLPGMSPADAAWLAASMRRVGLPDNDLLLVSARRRLSETQRSDGGWPSDDGPVFEVHTTLTAIRACRSATGPAAPGGLA